MKKEFHFKIKADFIVLCLLVIMSGRLKVFAAYIVAMALHEGAHILTARHYNYRCISLTLSCFGAAIYGDFEEAVSRQQVIIALSAPLINIAFACLLVALWYLFPDCYQYLLELALSNIIMGAVNLFPCYPLDGGKALIYLLERKIGFSAAYAFSRAIAGVFSLVLFATFVVGILFGYSLFAVGLFAVLLLTSALNKPKSNPFEKITVFGFNAEKLRRGIEKRTLVFSGECTLLDVVGRMEKDILYDIILLAENGKTVSKIPHEELTKICLSSDYSLSLDQLSKKL